MKRQCCCKPSQAAAVSRSLRPTKFVAAAFPPAAPQAVVDLAVQQLGLEPVHSAAAPEGTYACTSQDGAAGAAVQAYRGSRVHW